MTIFINNKSTNFCQITLRIKRLIHKKSCSFFLPHGVYWPVEVATTRYRLFTSTSILLSLSSSATCNSQSCVPSWVTWCLPSLGNELLMLVNSRLPRWVAYTIYGRCVNWRLALSCHCQFWLFHQLSVCARVLSILIKYLSKDVATLPAKYRHDSMQSLLPRDAMHPRY